MNEQRKCREIFEQKQLRTRWDGEKELWYISIIDGKFYKTEVADTAQVFRLIQSISSPKAEPFKLWLAHSAAER